ncbi:hypothetical protein PRIPAC_91365 [Pristionchus pacificus]|uniref:Uncharacterized protein n=1 Tax=Pristionchus pacificus TaxID=54126 RepID=A0A2A6CXD6_PRIPA|nr:hypothetical protein PRIPAC_91365 [Pristionchus pacificus]|eukprot:PDM82691.1 hypothetical protein PRIPAC_37084 [Pristionchus pacificus]
MCKCAMHFGQDHRYSDNVRVAPENTVIGKSSRMKKKAKFKPISERDNPIQCDHRSMVPPHFHAHNGNPLDGLLLISIS